MEGGEATIAGSTAFLQLNGENMSSPVWQREWTNGIHQALRGAPREETGAGIALDEIWHAAPNLRRRTPRRQGLCSGGPD